MVSTATVPSWSLENLGPRAAALHAIAVEQLKARREDEAFKVLGRIQVDAERDIAARDLIRRMLEEVDRQIEVGSDPKAAEEGIRRIEGRVRGLADPSLRSYFFLQLAGQAETLGLTASQHLKSDSAAFIALAVAEAEAIPDDRGRGWLGGLVLSGALAGLGFVATNLTSSLLSNLGKQLSEMALLIPRPGPTRRP